MTDRASGGNPPGVDWTRPAYFAMTRDASRGVSAPVLAFDEVFRAHASFVHRVLLRLGVQHADVDDALQEVFLVVARRLATYEERDALRAWLFTIARKVALHTRRTEARSQNRVKHAVRVAQEHDSGLGPEDALAQRQDAELALRMLENLPADQAMVFYLSEIEGFTAPEIAASLQIKLNTVYARLRLSRARIEHWMKRLPARAGEL